MADLVKKIEDDIDGAEKNADGLLKIGNNAIDFGQKISKLSTGGIEGKRRRLKINIKNDSTSEKLRLEESWFGSGRFWNQIRGFIEPGKGEVFSVCNKDYCLTGVSGGVGFKVYANNGEPVGWLICVFSHPSLGSVKGKCTFIELDASGNNQEPVRMIRDLWNKMYDDKPVYEKKCEFCKPDGTDDLVLEFALKDGN